MKMRKFLSATLIFASLALMLVSCGEPPSADDDVPTLDALDWTFEVEGADKTEYTMTDAKTHDIVKAYVSGYNDNVVSGAPQVSTKIWEGIKVSDFLADVGVKDYKSITIVGTKGNELEVDKKIADNEKSILAWTENKKNIISDSDSYIAYGSELGGKNDLVFSVAKIIINK